MSLGAGFELEQTAQYHHRGDCEEFREERGAEKVVSGMEWVCRRGKHCNGTIPATK